MDDYKAQKHEVLKHLALAWAASTDVPSSRDRALNYLQEAIEFSKQCPKSIGITSHAFISSWSLHDDEHY